MGMAKILLLDTASLYWRSYFALPDSITAPDGTPVNAVRGLLDTISLLVEKRGPNRVIACWDNDWRPTWRVDAVPGYKSHRVEEATDEVVPDTLSPQIPLIWQVLPLLGITIHGVDGWEADDVIARLAGLYGQSATPVDIASGDRDLMQLVTPTTTMLYTGGTNKTRGGEPWLTLTPDGVTERYGVAPEQYALMAALRGDPSDGLPGVAGIGERTAANLIGAFGDLAGLLAAAKVDPPVRPMTPRLASTLTESTAALTAAYYITDLRPDTDIPPAPPSPVLDPVAAREFGAAWGVSRSIERAIAVMEPMST